jgi:hypothetical protein
MLNAIRASLLLGVLAADTTVGSATFVQAAAASSLLGIWPLRASNSKTIGWRCVDTWDRRCLAARSRLTE